MLSVVAVRAYIFHHFIVIFKTIFYARPNFSFEIYGICRQSCLMLHVDLCIIIKLTRVENEIDWSCEAIISASDIKDYCY